MVEFSLQMFKRMKHDDNNKCVGMVIISSLD
jgi:hypothetical protein